MTDCQHPDGKKVCEMEFYVCLLCSCFAEKCVLLRLDQSKMIPFHAHLLSEATEVSKVWLLHFILGSFL